MNISNLNSFPFPKEVFNLAHETVYKILGKIQEPVKFEGPNFFIPKNLLLENRRAAIELMWLSGYYHASEIGRLFGVSRESGRHWVDRIDEKFHDLRLNWISLNQLRRGPLKRYIAYYIKSGDLDCRQTFSKRVINPEGLESLIARHEAMLAIKACPICGKKSPHYKYCSLTCKRIADRTRVRHDFEILTYHNCRDWAKPIYAWSHSGKEYQDTDFISYDEAARMARTSIATIFYWARKDLFTIRWLEATDKAGRVRARTAIPKEQIEMFKDANPFLKKANQK